MHAGGLFSWVGRRPHRSLHALTGICLGKHMKTLLSAFEVVAEPNRRRLLDLLREGRRPVGELVESIGRTGALLGVAGGSRGEVRDADGEPMSRTPSRRRSLSSPADTRLPSPAAFPGGARQVPGSLGWLWRLELQHHALWGGPRAGARCALAVGNPRCSTIALTPPAPFTTASTHCHKSSTLD